jgi:hypothetical protein
MNVFGAQAHTELMHVAPPVHTLTPRVHVMPGGTVDLNKPCEFSLATRIASNA